MTQLLDRWFAHAETRLSPTTLRGYRRLARQRILPRFGDRPIASITTAELDYFYDGLSAEGLSAQTVRNIHRVVHRAYAHAIRWGWVTVNPATNTQPPVRLEERRQLLTMAHIAAALMAAREVDAEFAVFLRLAASTGARRGELCALRWSDLNLEERTCRIARSIAGCEGGWVEKATKTRKERDLMLDFGTVDELVLHRKKMDERAALGLTEVGHDAFVFSSRLDCTTPWHPDAVTHRWAETRASAGLPDWARLHDVRHAHASLLIDAGLPISAVSERLGHTSQTVTLNVYSHAFKQRDSEAAAVIGTLLDSGGDDGH